MNVSSGIGEAGCKLPYVIFLLTVDVGTRLVTSEERGNDSAVVLERTLWVVLSCTTVPLVGALILLAVRCSAVHSRRRRHGHQHTHLTSKSFADHVITSTAAAANNAANQQLALGYIQHQVNNSHHCT